MGIAVCVCRTEHEKVKTAEDTKFFVFTLVITSVLGRCLLHIMANTPKQFIWIHEILMKKQPSVRFELRIKRVNVSTF